MHWTDEQTVFVRGHSPWVEGLFHPNKDLHDFAMWHLELESKYDRRWHWWSLRVPPPLWTMVFIDKPKPDPVSSLLGTLIGWAVAAYTVWRAL